jgi:hypothetical protein
MIWRLECVCVLGEIGLDCVVVVGLRWEWLEMGWGEDEVWGEFLLREGSVVEMEIFLAREWLLLVEGMWI